MNEMFVSNIEMYLIGLRHSCLTPPPPVNSDIEAISAAFVSLMGSILSDRVAFSE